MFCFFNDTATTEIYTLSLHDALPIFQDIFSTRQEQESDCHSAGPGTARIHLGNRNEDRTATQALTKNHLETAARSEEHTSELQSRQYLVCRLMLEKKNQVCCHSHPLL